MDLEQCLGFYASFQSILLPNHNTQTIQKIDQYEEKLSENFHLKINLKLEDIITAKNIGIQNQNTHQKVYQKNRNQTQKENKFRF